MKFAQKVPGGGNDSLRFTHISAKLSTRTKDRNREFMELFTKLSTLSTFSGERLRTKNFFAENKCFVIYDKINDFAEKVKKIA